MFFNTKVIALLSALSSGALAADVFSRFLDANGAEIGSTQFDVGDTGCFSLSMKSSQISFSQSGSSSTATGPYCLTAYADASCPSGQEVTQQFQDVDVTGSTKYQLETGLNGAGSYHWNAAAC